MLLAWRMEWGVKETVVPSDCLNSAIALAYAGCPSTLMTRGAGPPPNRARRRNSFAAIRARFGDNKNSIVSPVEWMARSKYAQSPATLT